MNNNTAWKEQYDKNHKPPKTALLDFWPDEIRRLFEEFSSIVASEYGLSLTQLAYSATHGWKFKYCKKSIELIKNVFILDDGFCIDAVCVKDSGDLLRAIDYVSALHTDDFIRGYNEKTAKRNHDQVERSKRRIAREAKEREEFLMRVDASKLNKYIWAPKVARQLLIRLYKSDAKMIQDNELLDEVGLMLYVRCLQGRDERLLANQGKLKCHHCKAVLPFTDDGLMECSCGYAYIFREYMRSFNTNSMPSRSATPFFNEFIDKWSKAKGYEEKMRIVDWIIHECHLNMLSGVKRHFAGINLIEGTKQQVSDLINNLAYGNLDNG